MDRPEFRRWFVELNSDLSQACVKRTGISHVAGALNAVVIHERDWLPRGDLICQHEQSAMSADHDRLDGMPKPPPLLILTRALQPN